MKEHCRETLAAVLALVIPSDEEPGAEEAGAVEYVLRLMKRTPHLQTLLEDGIELLERICQARCGRAFLACSSIEREEGLRYLESECGEEGARLLRTFVRLAIAGFLCHPEHGGNRNMVGWGFIGYEPRPSVTDMGS